ncbi:DUF4240 domain-containing protein [Nonomuraea soli]|uniref:DUF4240 domain-containing protein n=1 Tax=Nonomuraea soli TaxID=1032476 RepID=A0A7W0HW69_9ACTN|nr:DUF4240 domain-containing protein [Nonomuraea soli]MBA2897787.1 hypothetical protein [Nonomuraea soli]
MDVDGFWDLVERSAQESSNREDRVAWLEDQLSRLPAEEIVDFEAWFTISADRACTWELYAACWMITTSGSSDGFECFVDWLISLGRAAFDKVMDCPDHIIDLPEVQRLFEMSRTFTRRRISRSRDGGIRLIRLIRTRRVCWPDEDWPGFKSFSYAATHAYEQVMGSDRAHPAEALRARGITSAFSFLSLVAQSNGEEWDFSVSAELMRRLPRLARHYGIAAEAAAEPAADAGPRRGS